MNKNKIVKRRARRYEQCGYCNRILGAGRMIDAVVSTEGEEGEGYHPACLDNELQYQNARVECEKENPKLKAEGAKQCAWRKLGERL